MKQNGDILKQNGDLIKLQGDLAKERGIMHALASSQTTAFQSCMERAFSLLEKNSERVVEANAQYSTPQKQAGQVGVIPFKTPVAVPIQEQFAVAEELTPYQESSYPKASILKITLGKDFASGCFTTVKMPVFSSLARSRNKSECSMRGVEAGKIYSVALSTSGVPYLWEKNTSKPPKSISGFTIQTKKGEHIIEDGCIEQVSVGQKYTLFL
jgi:hypothetical protein